MVATWTDEQLAATIWVSFTFGPWLIIEMWVRWNRNLDRIAVAGAALARFANGDTPADLVEMARGRDADNLGVRADPARAPVDGHQGV